MPSFDDFMKAISLNTRLNIEGKIECPSTSYAAPDCYAKIISGLSEMGVVAIYDLPDNTQEDITEVFIKTTKMFENLESGIVPQHPLKLKEPSPDNFNFTDYKQPFAECYWASRLLAVMCDASLSHSFMAFLKVSLQCDDISTLQQSLCGYYCFTQDLFKQIFRHIELSYNLPANSIQEKNLGEVYIGSSLYANGSNEQIDHLFKENNLYHTAEPNNDQVVMFTPHVDFSALSCLTYDRNDMSGLVVKPHTQDHWSQLCLPGIIQGNKSALIIFSGKILELTTMGRIKPLPHTVLLPNKSSLRRHMLATFSVYNGDVIQPAKQGEDDETKTNSPFNKYGFLNNSVAKETLRMSHFEDLEVIRSNFRVNTEEERDRIKAGLK